MRDKGCTCSLSFSLHPQLQFTFLWLWGTCKLWWNLWCNPWGNYEGLNGAFLSAGRSSLILLADVIPWIDKASLVPYIVCTLRAMIQLRMSGWSWYGTQRAYYGTMEFISCDWSIEAGHYWDRELVSNSISTRTHVLGRAAWPRRDLHMPGKSPWWRHPAEIWISKVHRGGSIYVQAGTRNRKITLHGLI